MTNCALSMLLLLRILVIVLDSDYLRDYINYYYFTTIVYCARDVLGFPFSVKAYRQAMLELMENIRNLKVLICLSAFQAFRVRDAFYAFIDEQGVCERLLHIIFLIEQSFH